MTWYEGCLVNNAQTYTRHEINEVMWQASKATNVIKSGNLGADKANIYIPSLLSDGSEREALSIKTGDYLVKGIVKDEITTNFPITALIKKYDAVKVTSVDLKDYGAVSMKHIQIGGA
jgi:hypothetical protein